MEDDPIIIQAALRDLADLDAKRADLLAFIERCRRYAAAGERPQNSAAPLERVAVPRKSASADQVMSAVHDVMEARGDCIALADLFGELTKRGVVIGGKNPRQNLSQKLSASGTFRSYGKRGWYFADEEPGAVRRECRLPEEEEPSDQPAYLNGAPAEHEFGAERH